MRALVLSVCLASSAFAGGWDGTWTGTLDGEPFTLELESRGRAKFLGQAGSWKPANGGLVVTDAEGTTYRGTMVNGQLVFQLDGGPLVLGRVARPKALPALKPKKSLPGKRVTPEGTELSVTVPKGFTSAWGELDGAEAFIISPSGGDAVGPAVYASARQLSSEEAQASAAQLLARWAPALAGKQVREGSFSVGGNPATDVEVETTWVGQPAHARLTVVRMDDWGIIFLGVAEQAKAAELAPLHETVVSSLKGKPPKAPIASRTTVGGTGGGAQGLKRCWREYVSSSSSGGGYSSTTVNIYPNGTYHWRSRMSMPGMSRTHEEPGTWSANASSITLSPQDGCPQVSWSYGFKGYALIMNGVRYIPCD